MKTERRLYQIGILLTYIFVITAQLIGVLDHSFNRRGNYLIESLDYIVWLIALIPLLWGLAALLGYGALSNKVKNIKFSRLHFIQYINKSISLFLSLVTMIILFWGEQLLLWLVLFLTLSFIWAWMNLIIDEKVHLGKIRLRVYTMLAGSAALFVVLLYPTPYMVTYPGLSMNLNHHAQVEGGEVRGEIVSVLVFERPAVPIDWIYAKAWPHYDFKKKLPTDEPLNERLRTVRVSMLNANDIAQAIAFQEAGIGKGFTSHGVRVMSIVEDSPAAETLIPGDLIIAASEIEVKSTIDLLEQIQEIIPGQTITLTLLRQDELLHIDILTRSYPEDVNQAFIGIQMTDEIQMDLPLNVDFKNYRVHVGGASHGAMLTLALINQLTESDLTHGLKVAGTGTIRLDGSIGTIGGIKQKAYTVERTGADVFFVPEQQLTEALKGAANLRIIPVKTLSDILEWLAAQTVT